MASSSSSSSSLISGSNPSRYDVFLSFRGEDTRYTFTSYLYKALCRSDIEGFIDNCEVRTGDEISSTLSNAIRSSSLSIVIFSKDYASSSWCLNELLEILECHKTRGHTILPIFYHVSPSEIRKQTGTYGEAFAIHEERFKETKDKVQKWRTALENVANLSGTVINHDRPEPEFIDEIVEDVLCKLKLTSSGDYVGPGLVGITSCIERVKSLLCIGMEDIRIIGIWGMGGIGKTTIAKAIFHRIAKQFEAVCFLTDVKNEAKKGLQHLQEKLLFKIFREQNLNMEDFMVRRLRRKKILVVLDDVDDSEHLKDLVDRNLYGPGSRIIITSRDRQMLKQIGTSVDEFELYEVEGLNDREALQLFNENAFKQSFSPEDYMELPRKVVSYCGGNPLALKVLGGYLLDRNMPEWNSLLEKLKKCPNLKIQKVLRISYDGLDIEEKEIFLFIACFFKEVDFDRVINILDGCDYSTRIGIGVLLDKCLLTITEKRLMMHDLIREMGHGIVIEESPKEPGKRSRLWDPQDIYNLFNKYEGTSKVESISLDLSQISDQLYLRPDAFNRMRKLKLLKFYIYSSYIRHKEMNIFEGVPESLPDLRYLCWHRYPSKSLPSKFNPNHLVELDMSFSNLQHLWKDIVDLGNLRKIRLQYCKQLIEVPDLSGAQNLHVMNLDGCSNLTKFPKISRNVKKLYLKWTAVEEIPSLSHLTSLQTLDLFGCSKITKFPQLSGAITYLYLDGNAIDEVPNSAIESLYKLVELQISYNRRLKNLPSMSHLTSLRLLSISGCSNITQFPDISSANLKMSGTAIEEIPSFVEHSTNIMDLELHDCRNLKRVSSGIYMLMGRVLNFSGCSELDNLPEFLENNREIYSLRLDGSAIKTLPSSIELLSRLTELYLSNCKNLESLPNSLCNLTNLLRLDLSGCFGVEKMLENVLSSSSSPGLCSLCELDLSECGMLEFPSALSCLSSLTWLRLKGNNFESLSLKHFTSLTILDISYCERLKYLQEFPLPSRLRSVDASHCISLETLPDKTVFSTGEMDVDQCFDYYNCLKLDLKACINIQTDMQTRIQLIANNAPETTSTSIREIWGYQEKVNFCFPGSEIPEWVSYQNEGSSLTIDLPPHWYNNFFGLVLCFVPSCDSSDGGGSIVDCTCNFIDSDCDFQEKICYLAIAQSYKTKLEHPKSDHVFVKYSESDNSSLSRMYSLCEKVRFQFSPSNDCCKVKQCGVHLVYKDKSKENQEEDSQKRIKQRNIVHEEQWKSSTSASKHRERPENDEEEGGHSEKRRRKKDKSSRSHYETQEEEADMMDDQDELEDEDANMNYRETTHQMDDQDDAAGENAQDLLAAAGLEDSDAEDEMVTSSLTGPITVEDVAYENSDPDISRLWPYEELKFRHLVSQRTQGLIQSTSSRCIMVISLVHIIWGLFQGLS